MSQRKLGQFELVGLLVEVGILIMGLVAIQAFVRDFWRPHEQISFANIASLQHAIDTACATGQERTINFEMPQPVAYFVSYFESLQPLSRNLLPRFQMRAKGNPNFLIYWGAFNPYYGLYAGDYYLDIPTRTFIWLKDIAQGTTLEQLKSIEQQVKGRTGTDEVIFDNIVLGTTNGTNRLLGDIGHWDGENYVFDKYFSLSHLEKSAPKYRACKGGLCFMTGRGVTVLPLQCKLPIILHKVHGDDDHVDFNLASPCKVAQLKVTRSDDCECEGRQITYRLWELGEHGLQPASEEQTHCIGEEIADDVWKAKGFGEPPAKFSCIKVKVDLDSGFCASRSEYETAFVEPSKFIDNSIVTKDMREVYKDLGDEECAWPDFDAYCSGAPTVGIAPIA